MTMNKKEQAQMSFLQNEAAVNRALRWSPGPVKKDLDPPGLDAKCYTRVYGWSFNMYNRNAYKTWSECNSHGDGHHTRGESSSGSQRAITQYSTKKLALQALRVALERQAAEWLLNIDNQIDACDATE